MYLTEMNAYAERRNRENEDLITAAWINAALQRSDKMPKLSALLKRGDDEVRDDAYIASKVRALKERFTK